ARSTPPGCSSDSPHRLPDPMAHDHAHDEHDHEHEHEHDHEHDDSTADREREYVRRQALAQIRQYPDVALRMRAREVTEFDEFLVQLVERMANLMHDAQGVGLAATQIGVLQRVFVFAPDGEPMRAVVNPQLTLDESEKLVAR